MNATKDKAVTISYKMTNEKGDVLDNTEDSDLIYLHGHENILPGLEKAIDGLKAGETFNFTLKPEDAFGEKQEDLIVTVGKENFETDNLEVGMQFQTLDQDENVVIATIIEVKEKEVVVDENHPLAGVSLKFEGAVKEVRDATEEEISHGHIHSGGCGHDHSHDHGHNHDHHDCCDHDH
ncbi:MAG: peptidylprolyl isomerase [Lentisphaeraceae bacterium]|nr:peptidylprolyl isomerase [Lentisphaeraceae bacterium]